MADLIDRAALFADMERTVVFSGRPGDEGMRNANKIIDRIKAAPAVNPFEHLHEMICESCNQQFSNEPCEPDECLILAALRTYVKENRWQD